MKIFVDSGLLIEYEKQTKTELLEALLMSQHQIKSRMKLFLKWLRHELYDRFKKYSNKRTFKTPILGC